MQQREFGHAGPNLMNDTVVDLPVVTYRLERSPVHMMKEATGVLVSNTASDTFATQVVAACTYILTSSMYNPHKSHKHESVQSYCAVSLIQGWNSVHTGESTDLRSAT